MATKPPAKPVAAPKEKEEAQVAAPPKSKKLLIISIALLLVIVAGGAAWFLLRGHAPADGHAEAPKPEAAQEAKFVALGDNFTVNLQREEGDRYLQAGITLKILQPELEEKIKAQMPEIRSKLLFLLSSKTPSELQTTAGKQKLVNEIIATVDGILGIAAVPAAPHETAAQPASGAASAAASAAAAVPPAPPKTTGVVDVLFTAFIIQ